MSSEFSYHNYKLSSIRSDSAQYIIKQSHYPTINLKTLREVFIYFPTSNTTDDSIRGLHN